MDLLIREAEKKDLQDVLLLYAQPDMDNGEVISVGQAEEIFNRMNNYPYYKVFVAVMENKIVGTFELLTMENLAHKARPSGIIEDVVVAEKYQWKGIGKEMMRFAVEHCKEMGCYKVALSSNIKREKAHQFYESLGFKKHGYSFLIEV